MKQPLLTGYTFAPVQQRIDFSGVTGFDVRRLFAVINLKANALVYATGSDGLGYTALSGSALTLAYDTTQMDPADPLLVVYEDGGAPLPADAATNTKLETLRTLLASAATSARQDAGNTTLASILSVLQAQIDFESSVWTDGTLYYVRREVLAEGTGTTTIVWTDPTGATVAAPSGARPVASDNAIALLSAYFDVRTAGTGYALGDVLARIVAVNKAVNPPSASSAIWLNMTTGAVITAPPAANIAETDQNVMATLGAGSATIGAVTNLSLGTPADAAATADTGTFSLPALVKRGLANWTTLLSRIPGTVAQDGADPGSPAVANAGTGIRGWLATIAGLLKLGSTVKASSASVTIATDLSAIEPAGAPITGAAMPAGGLGLTGWLSAIWSAYLARSAYNAPLLFNGALGANASTATADRDAGAAPSAYGRYGVFVRAEVATTVNIYAKTAVGAGPSVLVLSQPVAAGTPTFISVPVIFRAYAAQLSNGATAAAAATLTDGFIQV